MSPSHPAKLFEALMHLTRNNIFCGKSRICCPCFSMLYFFLLLSVTLKAQPKAFRQVTQSADVYFEQEKYENALALYNQALRYDTANIDILYRLGQCCYHIREKRGLAIDYFIRAQRHEEFNRATSPKTEYQTLPPQIYYLLGDLYLRAKDYNNALQNLLWFKEIMMSENNIMAIEKANFKIQSVAIAQSMMDNPVDVAFENLGPTINTRFSDYNPVVTPDENRLLFTSFWESADLIFEAERIDSGWAAKKEISKQLQSDGSMYTTAISADGNELFLIKMDEFRSDIYVSERKYGQWGPAQKLPRAVNSRNYETSATITSDGKTLYFSSNRKGNFDLYQANRVNNRWKKAVRLNNTINSPYQEEGPAISADGKRLYFSSDGHWNMGGMDIFVSLMQEDGEWSKPQNLGYPINTPDDDLFFAPVGHGNAGYYSRYSADGFGKNDIYRVQCLSDTSYKAAASDISGDMMHYPPQEDLLDNIGPEVIPYTIQIIALRRYLDPKYFKEAGEITVYEEGDGLHRYLSGRFNSVAEASDDLTRLKKLGYSDAFIRKLPTYNLFQHEEINE